MPGTAIFFDLDGTLVDTEGLAVDATREVLEAHRRRLEPADEPAIVGRPWIEVARWACAHFRLAAAPEAVSAAMIESFRRRTAEGVRPVPGAAEAVRALAAHHRLLVVSGSPRWDIELALRSLGVRDRFESLVGAEDYVHGKPAPDPFREALARTGLAPGACLVFEDSTAGIRSALAAGLAVVAITGAQHAPQSIEGARWTLPDLTAVTAEWVAARLIQTNV